VVPKFTAVYHQTSQTLPGPTQALLAISDFFEAGWIFILIAVVLIFAAFRAMMRFGRFRLAMDSFVLRLPVYGTTLRCWQMYRFAGTMSLLVNGGVTALQALKLSAGVVGSANVRRDIELIAQSVERGQRISTAMSNSRFFDDTTLEMIFVSETTGRLGNVFARLAAQHHRDFQARVDLMLSLLEPVIIVIMSVIVGLTVTAMLLPVFSMDSLLE
ncbi:MAG TPA: type II secretion system F family protein, partial [Phycisphaerae bacterium]|nr:type II secretion system F family protein [Phycisphaerae bacterium]